MLSQHHMQLLNDCWTNILSFLDRKTLRELASISQTFYQLIHQKNCFQIVPWPPIDYQALTTIPVPFDVRGCQYYQFANANFALVNNWSNCKIYLWTLNAKAPVKFSQHTANIIDLITFDSQCMASLGVDGMRIWHAKTADQHHHLLLGKEAKPIKLLQNHDKIFCIYQNGQVDQWDQRGKCIQYNGPLLKEELLISNIINAAFINHQLTLLHSANSTSDYNTRNHRVTRWDIKDGTLITDITLNDYKPQLMALMQKNSVNVNPIYNPSFKKIVDNFLIMQYEDFDFLINMKSPLAPLFIGQSFSCQYHTLTDGTLLILNKNIAENYLEILAHYDENKNDFLIKTHIKEKSSHKDKNYTVLPNGDVITIYGNYIDSSKWSLQKRQFIPNFKLQPISIKRIDCNHHGTDIAVHTLPSGDILSYYRSYDGVLIIWDAVSGAVKLNYTLPPRGYSHENKVALANGNLVMQWKERNYPDDADIYAMLLQFNSQYFANHQIVKPTDESIVPRSSYKK